MLCARAMSQWLPEASGHVTRLPQGQVIRGVEIVSASERRQCRVVVGLNVAGQSRRNEAEILPATSHVFHYYRLADSSTARNEHSTRL